MDLKASSQTTNMGEGIISSVSSQPIPNDVRAIARKYALCFTCFDDSDTLVMHHATGRNGVYDGAFLVPPEYRKYYEKPPEKRLQGGFIYFPGDDTLHAFGEFCNTSNGNIIVASPPNIDTSLLEQIDGSFAVVPIGELERYLYQLYTLHINNGRASAIPITYYLEPKKINPTQKKLPDFGIQEPISKQMTLFKF